MEYSKEQAFVDTVQAKSHQLYRNSLLQRDPCAVLGERT